MVGNPVYYSDNCIAFVSGFNAHVDPGLDPQNTDLFIASTFVVQYGTY
jgi:hypothetical protein